MMVVLALGGGLLLLGAAIAAFTTRIGRSLAAQAAGITLVGVAGCAALINDTSIGSPFRNGVTIGFGVDGLTGLFLVVLAITAVPTLLYSRAYLAGITDAAKRRAVCALMAAFLLALIGVLTARDVVSFLAAWELMTVVPAASILVIRRDPVARAAVATYVAITHLAGVGVWTALLVAAHVGALGDPHAMARAGTGIEALIAVAGLIGFGTKAGLVPLHTWLPRVHPLAPAPMSALMSGVMIKVAIYGLIRVEFSWITSPPLWLGLVVITTGAVSAVGGILWALAQRDLKRLLAYSSIENVGIVTIGLGAALLFLHADDRLWASIAFAAALLHAGNHALFKTLLFLGAGVVERAAGTLDLDRLGGLLRTMPWAAGALLVGLLAIAGVPPLNGFASEWLTLQSLLHLGLRGPLTTALPGAVVLAVLGCAAALALLCFVKVAGLALLGPPRTERSAEAVEPPRVMRVGMAVLAGGCVILGVVPGLVFPVLTRLLPGPDGAAPAGGATAHLTSTVPGLPVPGGGALPALGIAVGLVALVGLLAALRGYRRPAPAPAPSWACGQRLVPELRWTSAAFTKPLRLVFEPLMRPQRTVTVERSGSVVRQVTYASDTPSLLDRVYEPAVAAALRGAARARRLQSGNVRTYAGYLLMLLAVMLVLLGSRVFG